MPNHLGNQLPGTSLNEKSEKIIGTAGSEDCLEICIPAALLATNHLMVPV